MKITRSLVVALLAVATGSTASAAEKKPAALVPAAPVAVAAPELVLPEVVATVEGADIKKEELERNFNGFLASQQIPAETLPPAEKLRGYRMVLDEMVQEKLIEKRAVGVKVTDAEVAETFKRFTASIGSEEEVKKQIEASGQTMEKLRENIRMSLRQDHWIEQELGRKGGVSDQDAQDFYKNNPDKFVSPEEVRASHILLKVEGDAKPEVVVSKEKAAKAIGERIKKGEDFAKLAAELSEDPSAKQNRGDLDFFTRDRMVPEFADAAFALKKGAVSEPVRSPFGYHIIKVTDRKEAGTVPLETVKPKLVEFLKQQKGEELKKAIREKAVVKINLPEPPPLPAPTEPEPTAP